MRSTATVLFSLTVATSKSRLLAHCQNYFPSANLNDSRKLPSEWLSLPLVYPLLLYYTFL